jgi:hypothetical protein
MGRENPGCPSRLILVPGMLETRLGGVAAGLQEAGSVPP